MVSGKDRGEAVHTRQICICDRTSYSAKARLCFRSSSDGDSAFRFPDPKAKARAAAWRRAVCQKRPGHWRSDKSSAPGGSCGVSLSLRRIERQAAESKAAKDRAVFYVRTRPDRKSPIAVGQSYLVWNDDNKSALSVALQSLYHSNCAVSYIFQST